MIRDIQELVFELRRRKGEDLSDPFDVERKRAQQCEEWKRPWGRIGKTIMCSTANEFIKSLNSWGGNLRLCNTTPEAQIAKISHCQSCFARIPHFMPFLKGLHQMIMNQFNSHMDGRFLCEGDRGKSCNHQVTTKWLQYNFQGASHSFPHRKGASPLSPLPLSLSLSPPLYTSCGIPTAL